MKRCNKLLSFALACLLVLGLFPATALQAAAADYTVLVEPSDEWGPNELGIEWEVNSIHGSSAAISRPHYIEKSTGRYISYAEYWELGGDYVVSDAERYEECYLVRINGNRIERVSEAYEGLAYSGCKDLYFATRNGEFGIINEKNEAVVEFGEYGMSVWGVDLYDEVIQLYGQDGPVLYDVNTGKTEPAPGEFYITPVRNGLYVSGYDEEVDGQILFGQVFRNRSGEVVLGPYWSASYFYNGYAVVGPSGGRPEGSYDDPPNYVIDTSGNVVFSDADKEYSLSTTKESQMPLFPVSKDGYIECRWGDWRDHIDGYVNIFTGETIKLEPGYESWGMFMSGYAVVYKWKNNKYALINQAGEIIDLDGLIISENSSISDTGVLWVKDEQGRLGAIQLPAAGTASSDLPAPASADRLELLSSEPVNGGFFTGDQSALTLQFNRKLSSNLNWFPGVGRTNAIRICDYATGETVLTIDDRQFFSLGGYTSGRSLTIPLAFVDLAPGKYYVEIDPGLITADRIDARGKLPSFAGITDKDTLAFTIIDPVSFAYKSTSGDIKTYPYYVYQGDAVSDRRPSDVSIDELLKPVPGLTYNDLWFTQDSYAYNHDLATMSLALDMAAFEVDDPFYAKDGYVRIRALYEALGFDVTHTLYVDRYGTEDKDSVALAMAAKQITGADGEPVTLVAVTLRGSGYGSGGWAGNLDVGTDPTYHAGFKKAADSAVESLKAYLNGTISNYDTDPGSIRFWITGYSRSAATANLLSAMLRKDDVAFACAENIYTYTFATPNNEIIGNVDPECDNIFNWVNPLDLVPQVPPVQWGFGKQGVTYLLPSATPSDQALAESFRYSFHALSGTEYRSVSGQRTMNNYILGMLTDGFSTRDVYARELQTALRNMMTGDNSEMDKIFCGVTTVDELSGLFERKNYLKAVARLGGAISTRQTLYGSEDPLLTVLCDLRDLLNRAATNLLSSGDAGVDGSTIGYLLDLIKAGFSSESLMQHWPEVYMAWMLTLDSDFDFSNLEESHYWIATFSCPVDVEVYDGLGALVARTVPETFTLTDEDGQSETVTLSVVDEAVTVLPVTLIGETKIIELPDDQDYRIVIRTNETYEAGDTMSYTVTEYENGAASASVIYEAVALAPDAEFTAEVAGGQDVAGCTLRSGGEALEPTAVQRYLSNPGRPASPFADVPADANYLDAVRWAVDAGVTNGTGKNAQGDDLFSPDAAVTRGQAVTFLWRAMGQPEPETAENPFSDVKAGSYYEKAVLWAVENGITNGMGGGKFAPDVSVTRGQMLTFLWRTLGEPDKTDAYDGKQWYSDPENWAAGLALTEGTAQTYATNDDCPRCDVVFYLWQALVDTVV